MIDAPRRQRRRLVLAAGAAAALGGCAAPLPLSPGKDSSPAARARLKQSADAHGLAAFAALRDVNLRFHGEWRALVGRLQPALVDSGFRVASEERLLPATGLLAQAHRGPAGRKQVVRSLPAPGRPQGEVKVWFNGEEALDTERRAAAALVADGYQLFLLGPIVVQRRLAERDNAPMSLGGIETVNDRPCDVLYAELTPGIGLSALDRIALYIDRRDNLMRKIRFSLDGLASTRGAIAEVETFDFVRRHGMWWPTRFYERLLRPIPNLPVHDFRLTGLDVNRGYEAATISGPQFEGAAAFPALPI